MVAIKRKPSSATTKKRPPSAVSGDGVSDSLWANNPSLAASLALVPLNSGEREKDVTEAAEEKNIVIGRELPPALVSAQIRSM